MALKNYLFFTVVDLRFRHFGERVCSRDTFALIPLIQLELELELSKLLELVLNNSNSYLTTQTRTQQLQLVLNNSNSYSELVFNNSNSYSTTRTRTRTQQLELELKKFIDVPSKLPYISITLTCLLLVLSMTVESILLAFT